MQVNSPRQDMLAQVHSAISDRTVTPQEMQTLQDTLAASTLSPSDKQAVSQLLTKLGEFTQRDGDQYLSQAELDSIQTLAAELESPAATRLSEEVKANNTLPMAAAAPGGGSAPVKKRSFFDMLLNALANMFNWIAGLFGGGDKNNAKTPAAGSAASNFAFQEPPNAPPQLPPLENLQDYSTSEFQSGDDYLNEYARPEVPTDPTIFNNYMAVPSRLGYAPENPEETPAEAAVNALAQPKLSGLNLPPQNGETPPTPITAQPRSGAMYQRSRYHDDTKFVPQFPMAAFHESGVYRRDWDPYAVGAISRPKKSDDLGGKTYGTYQFESSVYVDGSSRNNRGGNGSTLHRFINDPANPFGAHLKATAQQYGLASKAFDALWTKFAREHNQAFGAAQEAFVLKDKGDNVSSFMNRAQLSPEVRQDPRIVDLIMGTTNHVGGLADSAANHLAQLQQRAGRKLTANEVGTALAEYKETRISSWFRSSPGAHAGLENRFNAEARAFA
jgi:hypothetical protein